MTHLIMVVQGCKTMLLTKLLEAAKLCSVGLQDHPVPQNAHVSKDSVGKTETKQESSICSPTVGDTHTQY